MSKINFLILICLTLSQWICQDNLGFLEEQTEISVNSFTNEKPYPINELVSGFIDGVKIFNNFPKNHSCQPNDQIIEDIQEIFHIIDKTTLHENIDKVIIKITLKFIEIITKIIRIPSECEIFVSDVNSLMKKLLNYSLDKEFALNLTIHIIKNSADFRNEFEKANELYKNEEFRKSGENFGELIFNVFLWQFKSNSFRVMLELQDKTNDPISSLDFMNGFNAGLSFYNNLPYEKECNINNQQFLEDLKELDNLIRNINYSDLLMQIHKIFDLTQNIINKIKKGTTACQQFAVEIEKVNKRLKDYVDSPTYIPNLTLHTLANIKKIQIMTSDAASLWTHKEFEKSGKAYGELVKYGAFWQFN